MTIDGKPRPVISEKTPRLIRTYTERSHLIRDINYLEPPFIVEIKPWKEYANNKQKQLYFVWVGQLAAETGNSPETMDKYLRKHNLPHRSSVVLNESMTELAKLSSLSKQEMFDYMARVQAWAATELSIELKSNKV